jgi:ArsR family transcriptional regulator
MIMQKKLTVIENEAECCTPASLTLPERQQAHTMAAVLAALADPTRLSIIMMLAKSAEAVCVCDITDSFDLGQPTISHHLKILREAGLISSDKRGKWVYYALVPHRLAEVQTVLAQLLPDKVLA